MTHFFFWQLRLLLLFGLLISAATTRAQTWQWANTPGAGAGSSTAVDASGNVYVTGSFSGTATFGATTLTSTGGDDVFVAKLTSSGVYQWAVRAGGSASEYSAGVAVDGSGNVLITGYFASPTAAFGTTTLTNAGGTDVFVAKLTPAGAWQWAVRAGGSAYEYCFDVAVDGSGNALITGGFSSPTVAFGATTITNGGSNDIFVAKLSSAGAWQWAVRAGGTGYDTSRSVAVDGSGNVLITGNFSLSGATFGTTSLSSVGDNDAFVAKLTAAGAWQWAKRAGGTGYDDSQSVAVDGSGNVLLTGFFASATAAFGATTLTSTGGYDMFVAKLTTAGAWQWATSAVGGSDEIAISLVVDGSGNVMVAGWFYSSAITFGTTTLANAGDDDVFVAKLTPAGMWQWATSAGGTNSDKAYGVAVDGSGNVVVTGTFTAPSATFGATTLTSPPTFSTIFVSSISQAPTVSSLLPAAGTPGATLTLTGTNLRDVSSVSVGGVLATSFSSVSATTLAVVVPAGAVTGPVAVTTPYGTATSAPFTVYAAPVLGSFTPASGSAGTTVSIYGANFTGATSVRFNSVAAVYVVNSATQITAIVPATATTGPISIVTPGGPVTSASLYTVTVPTTTTVSAFTPTSGPVGTLVTVSGLNLTGATDVSFGGVAATSFTPVSATSLTATVPVGGLTGPISVTAPAGTGQSAASFLVTASAPVIGSVSPGSGPAGAPIAITGTGFAGATAVSFNNVAAGFTIVSPTQITTTVPFTAASGFVRVTTAGGTAVSPASFTVLASSSVVFDIDSLTTMPGTQVVIPVRVRGFVSMLGLQGTLQFNSAQLTFIGVEQLNASLTGLAQANFNTSAAASAGRVSVAYLNSSNTALTLADNSVIFALRFSVPATTAAGGRLPIWWAPGPVPNVVTRSIFSTTVPQTLGGAVRMPAAAALSGTVRTSSSALVPGVTIGVSGPLAPAAPLTLAAGTYSLPALVSTGSYTLTPSKANDVTVTNGIDITDIALIQRHILGTALLGVAYKVVSADVNNDAALTVADVASVQSVILGNATSFTGGALWRFYNSAQTFANPNSPWPLQQTRTYASLATATAQDFVGCKLGDVNDSWNAAIPRSSGVAPDTLRVFISSGSLPSNGRLRLPLVVEAGPACGGLQGEIAWNPAELRYVGTAAARPGLVVGVPDTVAGHLPLLWTDPAGQPLRGPATLVELEFAARLGTPPGVVTLVDGPRTALLALDSALAPLTLQVLAGTLTVGPVAQGVGGSLAASAVLRLWPNPARGTVRVAGASPGSAVRLLDLTGRSVRAVSADADGGATLDLAGLPAGVYTVRGGARTQRLLVEAGR